MTTESIGSPTVQLLAMSASPPPDDLADAFDAFLIKPFTMKQLADALADSKTSPMVASPLESASALNETVYQRMAASMPASQLHQLYEFCLNDVQTRIDRMRLAAASKEDATFRNEAHTIKGGCGMVGATELQRLASEAERSGLIPANYVASLDEMLSACDRLRRILVARQNQGSL
jgi:HPt (histidine-containing phosphotransfer) domain-containing protein